MQIVFRVEYGRNIGMGHLMRCMVLADGLQRQGMTVAFLCQPQTRVVIQRTCPDMECFLLPTDYHAKEDAAYCQAQLAVLPDMPRWLVVDHYGLDRAWETAMRPFTQAIMVIDDLARPHECDLLLDFNYRLSTERIYTVPKECRLLLGTHYTLLRRGFRTLPRKPQTSIHRPARIFVCFGGTDPHSMTMKTLEALKSLSVEADIVIGPNHETENAISELCLTQKGWHLWVDHPQPEQLMAKADLGIGAGGTMTLERCAAGLPSIVISVADNQRNACQAMADRYIFYLGHYDTISTQAISDSVTHLLNDRTTCAEMAAAGPKLVNTHGVDEVIRAMTAIA